MDVDFSTNKILLTAYFSSKPSELDLELLYDIETNSDEHIPDLYVDSKVKLISELKKNNMIL